MKGGIFLNRKILWLLFFISYFFCDFSVVSHKLYYEHSMSFSSLMAIALRTCIFYLIGILILQSFTNLCKFFFWKLSGYSGNAVFIYPLLFKKNTNSQKYRIYISVNVFALFDTYYPSNLIENLAISYNEKEVNRLSINCELSGMFGALLLYVIGIIISNYNFHYMVWGYISLICPIVAVSFLKTSSYHGPITKIKNCKKGKGIYYIANFSILFIDRYNDIYRNFEKWLLQKSDNEFLCYTIKILRDIYMIRCKNNFPMNPITYEYISKNILDGQSISLTSCEGNEKWDFLKVFLCNAILNHYIDDLDRVINEMIALKHKYNIGRIGDIIQWYIYLGKYKRLVHQKEILRGSIIRKRGFNTNFENYKLIFTYICDSIKNYCTNNEV